MDRSPIQEHTSAIIKGLIEETKAIRNLEHHPENLARGIGKLIYS